MSHEDSAIEGSQRELDRSLVSGMAWTGAFRWAAQAVSWAGTAVAARILTPADYGLVGMAMLAIGLVRMVEDFGMDSILVQDRTLDGQRQAKLAGFVLLTGIAFSALFFFLARPIASFFHEPEVASLVAVLGLLCITDALQVVSKALLQRQMKFGLLAALQFIQVLATQAILVIGVLLGWGAWSLVFNVLGGAVLVTIVLLYVQPFVLRWPSGLSDLSRPLLQGWRLLASRFAWYGYSSADQTIIGRFLGKDALGTYSFAMTFSTTVSQEFTAVVSKVVPGVFSRVQDRSLDLRRYFSLLTDLLCLVTFPVCLGTAVVADLLVAVVLGPQWGMVVAPLRLLCVYAAYYSSQVLFGHVLMWTGRFRANMWCSLLAMIFIPICLYIGSRWGLAGIAWAWVIALPLANIPAFVIVFRILNITVWHWLADLLPALAASLVMVLAVSGVRGILPADINAAYALLCLVSVGAAVYALTLWLLFRQRLMKHVAFVNTLRKSPTVSDLRSI